ncbi:MAG: PHP domain-containing protein [Thermoanaerobaculia bacterium]
MNRDAVAEALERIAELLALKGENPFKVRAFENAATTVAGLPDLPALVREGKLESVKGIGKSIAVEIAALVTTGSSPALASLEEEVPSTLPALLRIPGLGTKKAAALWKELGVTSLGELEYAIRESRLVLLAGFGLKTQEKIAEGIRFVRSTEGRARLPEAWRQAEAARAFLLSAAAKPADVTRVEVAGELRRGCETVSDVTLVVACGTPAKLPAISSEPGELSVTVDAGPKETFGNRLLRSTGSQAHLAVLEERDTDGVLRSPSFEESTLYERLHLAFIPPELREGRGEVELAARNALPVLLAPDDVRGLFHVHSTWSDGKATLEEIFRRAVELGHAYIGITDHSPAAAYARGLTPERVREQWAEIETLQPKFPSLSILRGTEADILPDGSVDYGDDFLAGFDFVIASVHSAFHLSRAEQTARLVRAVRNPRVTMLGHATGRLLLARKGFDVDLATVLAAAGDAGCGAELNASPWRLDLDWRFAQEARRHGVFTSINPDAHDLDGLLDVRWGVAVARKGGFRPADVLNALPAGDVVRKLSHLRARG